MTTKPYKKLNPLVKVILSDNSKAKEVIDKWLSIQYFSRFKNTHNSFTLIKDKPYVSMKNLSFWSGLDKSSIYQYLRRYPDLFNLLGLEVFEEEFGSNRLLAASNLGLDKYISMTKSIYLFSPSCVALILLASPSEKSQNFREFISDWSPENSYSLVKLFATLVPLSNERVR